MSTPQLTLVPDPLPRLQRIDSSMRMRWTAAVLLVACSAIIALFFLARANEHDRAPAKEAAQRTSLRPDPAAVRYRHPRAAPDAVAATATAAALPVGVSPAQDLDDGIAALAARTAGPSGDGATPGATASPIDLTELADLYFRRGRLAGNPADYAAAEKLALRSLEILPSPNGAVLVLAKLANTRHDFARAIEFASKHQRGTSPGALSALATAYLALGELPEATRAAEALVLAQPTSASYLQRALTLQAQGRDAEAAFDFGRAAIAEEAGDVQEAARLRALWARFLLRRGELRGAAELIDEALRIAPGHSLATAQRGELLLRSGQPEQAAARFEQAFASSRQVRYLLDQARAQELSGDLDGAVALRRQVERLVRAELTDGGLGHRLDLIEVLVDLGGSDATAEAIALGRQELAHRPSAETRFQLARALASAGQSHEALEQVHSALASGTREPQLYELAARLEVGRHNTARAALYSRLARELDPSNSGWRQAGIGGAP